MHFKRGPGGLCLLVILVMSGFQYRSETAVCRGVHKECAGVWATSAESAAAGVWGTRERAALLAGFAAYAGVQVSPVFNWLRLTLRCLADEAGMVARAACLSMHHPQPSRRLQPVPLPRPCLTALALSDALEVSAVGAAFVVPADVSQLCSGGMQAYIVLGTSLSGPSAAWVLTRQSQEEEGAADPARPSSGGRPSSAGAAPGDAEAGLAPVGPAEQQQLPKAPAAGRVQGGATPPTKVRRRGTDAHSKQVLWPAESVHLHAPAVQLLWCHTEGVRPSALQLKSLHQAFLTVCKACVRASCKSRLYLLVWWVSCCRRRRLMRLLM